MEPEARAQRTIIVGIDGTERGEDALALARLIASGNARIVLVAVSDGQAAEAEQWLSQAAASHPDGGLETRTAAAHSPARGLREVAEETGAELIVVGSTHRGWLGRILPGSVGERLLHAAPCAVGIAPRGFALAPHEQLRTLAAAYDTSTESEAAVSFAADLAAGAGAALRIMTVADTQLAGHPGPIAAGAYLDIARSKHDRLQAALDHLDQLLGTLPQGLRVETWLLDGNPAQRLLDEAEGDIDLLVLGSRGYGAAARALMGSVLGTVIKSAASPVVMVPRRDESEDEQPAAAAGLSASRS